ncbi:MAG TPA: hypothetical protein VF743_11010 [Acidimicrobiales bacterium]
MATAERGPSGPAHEVAGLAQRLADGLHSQLTAIDVAASPRAVELLPPVPPGQLRVGALPTKDGATSSWDPVHHLERLRTDRDLPGELRRLWLMGALLTLGDTLAAQGYFDQAPTLEMVRHMRHAVAHGNRFNLDLSSAARLTRHPAHTRDAAYGSGRGTWFEVTPALHGTTLLFDYMEAADVVLLLLSVAVHLDGLAAP